MLHAFASCCLVCCQAHQSIMGPVMRNGGLGCWWVYIAALLRWVAGSQLHSCSPWGGPAEEIVSRKGIWTLSAALGF